MAYNQYVGENYKAYFQTNHWRKLKETLIYSNRDAKCWICEFPSNLLIHHESYDNLFKERLYKDIFIFCYGCHSQLHFRTFLHFFRIKTPLRKWNLKRRRLFLRAIFCVRRRGIGLQIWYFLRYLITI